MSKKFVLGVFMPFGGIRVDSGAATYPVIETDPRLINDVVKKSIVREIGEVKWTPCEKVKFSNMKKEIRK